MATARPASKIGLDPSKRLEPAKTAVIRAEIGIFPSFSGYAAIGVDDVSRDSVARFSVANFICLCHKPQLHRPADQGLPCRCPCGLSHFGDSLALSTL